jgi:hypothetical protein
MEDEKKPISISLDDAKAKLTSFGTQIQEYLGKAGANIETYKFSVEKMKDGIAVDVAFRATLKGSKES